MILILYSAIVTYLILMLIMDEEKFHVIQSLQYFLIIKIYLVKLQQTKYDYHFTAKCYIELQLW